MNINIRFDIKDIDYYNRNKSNDSTHILISLQVT